MSDKINTDVLEDEKETSDLLALLYPEDGAETEGSEFVSDDEFLGMQRVRSLFRDMPEQEPSDAVTNRLLAMAAQHAPKPAAGSKGIFAWFSDLLMPLVAQPGFAAAATLVLVVGVAGTLYVKGGAEMAQPQVSSRAEAPSEDPVYSSNVANEPIGEGAAAGLLGGKSIKGGDRAVFKEGKASKGNSATPGKQRKSRSKSAVGDLNFGGGQGTGSGPGGGGQADERRVIGIVDAPDVSPKSKAPRGGTEVAAEPVVVTPEQQVRAPTRSSEQKNKPSPKPKKRPATQSYDKLSSAPPAPPADAVGANDDSDEADEADKKDEDKKASPKAPNLHAKAISAAKRGDCARVLSLGRQIRSIDSGYYDRTFLQDARLKACRSVKK
ncbi:MAG: hypothetical protein GY811_11065 [Myxococcales bacterium]|nr:hypothetical protein [Myxococcales bacterium]